MDLSRADIENLSASLEEPDWVLALRVKAWEGLSQMSLPGEREEPWRYTNLAQLKFKLDGFGTLLPISNNGSKRRSANGTMPAVIDAGSAARGVIVTDLQTAIRRHPELVRPHLFSQFDPTSHIFAALHGALFRGGTFVYVPEGVTVTLPLESLVHVDPVETAVFPHTLVVVEEGAEVAFLETFESGERKGAALCDAALEVVAGQAARVFVATLQTFGTDVWHFQSQRSSIARDVALKSVLVTLGGRFSRTESSTVMTGAGDTVDMLGLYLARAGQHFDFRTLQDHAASHGTSDLLYKGALRDDARTVYSGLIHVRPEGQETDAYQTNRNLVLSDHAKANSKPELEIENNDVRCSHAASVGQIDEDEVFYLQSRGIDRSEAEHLIVKGFFEEVLGRIGRKDIATVLESALESRLSA
jgi:Fe-S cluster assembly protein SufD